MRIARLYSSRRNMGQAFGTGPPQSFCIFSFVVSFVCFHFCIFPFVVSLLNNLFRNISFVFLVQFLSPPVSRDFSWTTPKISRDRQPYSFTVCVQYVEVIYSKHAPFISPTRQKKGSTVQEERRSPRMS